MVVFKKEIRIIRRLGFAACLSKNFVQKLIFIYVDMFDGADDTDSCDPAVASGKAEWTQRKRFSQRSEKGKEKRDGHWPVPLHAYIIILFRSYFPNAASFDLILST